MNKIEQIEEYIRTWKASTEAAEFRGDLRFEMYSRGRVDAFKSALEIIKRPSNTRMHVDTKPIQSCKECGAIGHEDYALHCLICGVRL